MVTGSRAESFHEILHDFGIVKAACFIESEVHIGEDAEENGGE
jgi:hypothetical protein